MFVFPGLGLYRRRRAGKLANAPKGGVTTKGRAGVPAFMKIAANPRRTAATD
ncbi:expressed unknown protein [Ectocarpus siliculosus]|uniref:Uncharacterized protein n=1 Tax=Ectocarpus siliculosus TaxID=2880 RepID=D7G8V4_ECTSI|nr:expressed unknown protein [Ectocarpus siliculosus]|eukprot:CBJ28122.1 expressed unknown protein [Ectocarpus siliculosus]